jgi:hypothetical protein
MVGWHRERCANKSRFAIVRTLRVLYGLAEGIGNPPHPARSEFAAKKICLQSRTLFR